MGKQNLTLLHVLYRDMAAAEFGSTVFDHQEFYDTREKLRGLIPPGVAAHATVELGIPADTIVRTAREQNSGLIVMGVNAKSALAATHLPWATAHRVICDSPCPVLTVR
jgi:nucleotide-binding universal stress UspA family protein